MYITAQDLYHIVTVSDPQFSPDGQWLAHVRTEIEPKSNSYKSAIWLAPVPAGRARQFTNGEKRDSAPRWSPDGRWLAFVSNRENGAKPQIYVMATDGGEAWRLTGMDNGAGEPAWSPDGRTLAFTSRVNQEEMAGEAEPGPDIPLDPDQVERRAQEKERAEKAKADPRVIDRFIYRAENHYLDDRSAHLYVVEIDPETGRASDKPRRLTVQERDYRDPRWLADGSALLAVAYRRPGQDDMLTYPDLVRIPLDGGPEQILTTPQTADVGPRPSPDGKWIAYNSLPVAEYSSANSRVMLMPAKGVQELAAGAQVPTGDLRIVAQDLDAHARELHWSPDSQSLCFLVSEKGRIDLCRAALDGGPVETLVSADRQILGYDLSPDGRQVGFVASTDRAPWDLYLADLDGSQETRLTEVNATWLDDRTLGDVEDLWFEGADGTPIQGWIVKPPHLDPGQRYPLVLSIHGGPHVMWSRHEATMWHEWQVLAARGYVVLACNPRGSDGYGRDFRTVLLNRWGEADLPDLLAGIDQVLAQGYVDPQRLVVTGGSYGGFMTAWVIGHDQRFKAAVAQRGVYDLISFYSTSDIPQLTEWEFDATPWQDPERMWHFSPLAYADKIQTPLLLIHSENDFRAPIPAAEGLFVALRRLQREVQMVRYPRDGHELSRSGEPKHRVDRLERIVAWFDHHLQAGE